MSSLVENFSTRLCNLKSQLISERRSLRRMKVEENKYDLQEQVEFRNTSCNQIVEGENPYQILFPEEIWMEIFERLKSIRDVQNCYNTCRLFQNYLQPLRNLIKFGAVLPFLVHTGHLSVSNLLTCRQVCKFWRDWVDELLENQSIWSQDAFSDTKTLLVYNTSNIKDEQLDHVNNPLIGRRVTLKSFSVRHVGRLTHVFTTPEEWFTSIISPNPACLRNIRILETVGKHIHHLVVEGDMINLLKIRFLEKINNCSDLKSLRLTNTRDPDSFCERSSSELEKYEKLVMAFPLPLLKLKALQKLELEAGRRRSKNIKAFYTSLVQKFSAQIKEFGVSEWDSDYNNNWEVLRKLTVKTCNSEEMLETIGKLKANKLQYLCIHFSSCSHRQTTWLEVLLKMLQQFPQLTCVQLTFQSGQWKLSEEQVVELWNKCSHLCSTSITNITLVNLNPDKITYSFLVFFPYLQKLTKNASKLSDNPTDNMTSPDLLELKDKISEIDSSILYSVVWYILPFLRSITIDSHRMKERRTFIRKLV